MDSQDFKRIPRHVGVIPDGNRRWAQGKGMGREAGYQYGVDAGFQMYRLCRELGVGELTLYGFTRDNTRRPAVQRREFQRACVDAVLRISGENASLRVIGDTTSAMFPPELIPYTQRRVFGDGDIKVNFLVNYDWAWDLGHIVEASDDDSAPRTAVPRGLASADVGRIDLIIRWGGRRRLSGFLPVQSVYADLYVVDAMWPDFSDAHLREALDWYQDQDITLGG